MQHSDDVKNACFSSWLPRCTVAERWLNDGGGVLLNQKGLQYKLNADRFKFVVIIVADKSFTFDSIYTRFISAFMRDACITMRN